jgi:hypothetical protein
VNHISQRFANYEEGGSAGSEIDGGVVVPPSPRHEEQRGKILSVLRRELLVDKAAFRNCMVSGKVSPRTARVVCNAFGFYV